MGNGISLQDRIRRDKQFINKSKRNLDKEILGLERQVIQTQVEIRKLLKNGQESHAKILIKQLVTLQKHTSKFQNMKTHLISMEIQITVMKTSHDVSQCMNKITKSMKQMNREMNITTIKELVQNYERETEISNDIQEGMNDVLEDVFTVESEDEDEVLNQIYDELSLDTLQNLQIAPNVHPIEIEEDSLEALKQKFMSL
jgi:charged multivesicular body protein 2A